LMQRFLDAVQRGEWGPRNPRASAGSITGVSVPDELALRGERD
jgi:hypothetical protein